MDNRIYESTDVRTNITGKYGKLLRTMAETDVRSPTTQIHWLIKQEAEQRGIWDTEDD